MNENKMIYGVTSRLVQPEAPDIMSDDFVREFNKFALSGCEVLLDWFDDRPGRLRPLCAPTRGRWTHLANLTVGMSR